MNSFIYRNMYRGIKILAFGKFYSNPKFLSGWGVSVILEGRGGALYEETLCVSNLIDCGAIFKFSSEDVIKYDSHKFVASFKFPPVAEWDDSNLLDCPAAPNFLGDANDFFNQRSFCFDAYGIRIWLPKLELAGRMFFHYQTLISSAFVPSGLDFNFCMIKCDHAIEIHAISKIGVSSWVFDDKSYREHLAWLLTEKDVRDSFNSIWSCMNQEKTLRSDSRYEWDFNFVPPTSLSGTKVTVMGCFSPDKKHLLIWEIVKIEIAVAANTKFVFYHPDLKLNNNAALNNASCFPSPSIPADSIHFLGGVDTYVSCASND